MELFLLDKKDQKEDIELKQFLIFCEKICNITYTDLNGVTPEEFNQKCKEASENIII